MIVIRDWNRLYEPNRHDVKRDGPLKYVQWRVHVDATGDYRRLARRAGDDLPACLGVFGKLLEMAGNEVRSRRNGTVYDDHHNPASIADVAFLAEFSEAIVSRCVDHLAAVGWVEIAESATTRDNPPQPAATGALTGTGRGTGMETETGTETETGMDPDPVEVSEKRESGSSPDSTPSGGHRGIIESTVLSLLRQFGVRVCDRSDDTPRARQADKDFSCFRGIAFAVITEADIDAAARQRDQLLAVAREVMTRRPEKRIPAFVALCRERFDSYAAYCARSNGTYRRADVPQHDRSPPGHKVGSAPADHCVATVEQSNSRKV